MQMYLLSSVLVLAQATKFFRLGLTALPADLHLLDYGQINLLWRWYSFYRPLIIFRFSTVSPEQGQFLIQSSTLQFCF